MKINHLLLVGLLAGQAMPSMAMENASLMAVQCCANTFDQAVDKLSSYLSLDVVDQKIQTACTKAFPRTRPVFNLMNAHPYLAGFLAGMGMGFAILGSFIGAKELWKTYDITWKINYLRGKISPTDHLVRAVQKNDLKDAQWALKRGADLTRGSLGERLCMEAIGKDNEKMVELLIKNGTDVTSGISLGFALLPNVNHRFNKSIAKKLIEAGANVNVSAGGMAGLTAREFAQAEAVRTGNQDYIDVFKPESKL